MAGNNARLSCEGPPRGDYDAIVVGSGYGGSILAHRLSDSGRRVAVLERGREFSDDDFPRTARAAARSVRVRGARIDVGAADALVDIRTGPDISVLVGCGLGGTSLINANVALRPERHVFTSRGWPTAISEDVDACLRYYDIAATKLGAQERLGSALAKQTALDAAAQELGGEPVKTPLYVTFREDPNAPPPPHTCTDCGNCVGGCPTGAKRTPLKSYLSEAVQYGAEVHTLARTLAVMPGSIRRWRVVGQQTGAPEARFAVEADIVVLSAGTLGSTEILLRSARAGLPLSRRIGSRFSGNGDFLGVVYGATTRLAAMGAEHPDLEGLAGPTISTSVRFNGQHPCLVQDGAIPRALATSMPAALLMSALAIGRPPPGRSRLEVLRNLPDLRAGPYEGATDHSMVLLLTSEDDDDGTLHLAGETLIAKWPGVAGRPSVGVHNARLNRVAEKLGGTYIPNPLWGGPLRRALVTVHPLGGCIMGDDAEHGVVDDRGRVYADATGTEVHPGLYVADGAVVPRSLGVNPSLTISALSERIAAKLLEDEDSGTPITPVQREVEQLPPAAPPGTAPGLVWHERLDGFASVDRGLDPDFGYDCGRADGSTVTIEVDVEIPDLRALLREPSLPCALSGVVKIPALRPGPLRVETGTFVLFQADPTRVDRWAMRYQMSLAGSRGRHFTLDGVKDLHDDPGWDAWPDLTTLRIVVTDEDGIVVCAGKASVSITGVALLVASMRVGRAGPLESMRLRAAFLERFIGSVNLVYGKALGTPQQFKQLEDAPWQPTLQPTSRHWFVAGHRWVETRPDDDAYCTIMLSNYKSPRTDKGPVLLAPGLAMAADSFLGPTDANFTQFLIDAGYDVWLFDYRASTALRSHIGSYTLDDVAREDWPTAVEHVRAATGADEVQIVGHCMGSMTAQMAVLGGMQGVRSMVCSQVTVHPRMTAFSRFKARARISALLQGAGERVVRPPKRLTLSTGLLDVMYRANPALKGERCSSPLCRWVFGYFGPTHHHDRLDRDGHDWVGHRFGSGGLDALDHIARMVRTGYAVDANGDNAYGVAPDRDDPFHRVERLRLPIRFLVGEHNKIFLPEGARTTFHWLEESNGPGLYDIALIRNYAHFDCFAGKNAARDVWPVILRHLDRHTHPAPSQ